MGSGDEGAIEKLFDQLIGVELGDVLGFMLDRGPAKRGMSCEGFEGKAEKKLLKLVGADPMFGPGRTTRQEPQAEPVTVGGCQGLRVKGKGTARDGDGKNLDVLAVSDGEVLFLFKLLNLDDYYSKNVVTFEQVLSTIDLAVAKRGKN